MNIDSFKIVPFKRRFKRPLTLKGRSYAYREGYYLICKDEHSNEVLTEIAPLPHWSKESLQEVLSQLKDLGKSEPITWETTSLESIFPSVAFGIESALTNSSLLDPAFGYTHAHLALNAQNIVESCSVQKVKIRGDSLEKDMNTLQSLIQKLPELRFRIDANQSWQVEDALKWIEKIPRKNIEYIEEPFDNLSDLKAFSEKTNLPLAVDEMIYEYDIKDLEKIPSLQTVVIKPTLFGGLQTIQKYIETFTKNIEIVFSSSFETEVGLCHIARLQNIINPHGPFLGIDTLKFFEKL